MNLALFDLDGTLLPGDSDHAFGEFVVAIGWADGADFHRRNDAFYADYQAGRLDIHAYVDFCTAPWRNRSDDELARIPADLINAKQSGMAFIGCRCAALDGKVGEKAACRIYEVRPIVCRDCLPGDEACTMARAHYGLAPLPPRSL